jgi:acetylornithine deacetylase/succinyl-diaminopimelate desuccinylase-like protein
VHYIKVLISLLISFHFRVGTSEKGQVVLRLEVKSDTGHSSMPLKEDAISILAQAVHRLETHFDT